MSREKFLEVETLATGASLNTLTQGQNANHLHQHADGVWINLPAPLNGWVSETGVNTPQYMVRADGWVFMRGVVNGEASTDALLIIWPDPGGTDLTLLPPGFVSFSTAYVFNALVRLGVLTQSSTAPELRFREIDAAPLQRVFLNSVRYQIDDQTVLNS